MKDDFTYTHTPWPEQTMNSPSWNELHGVDVVTVNPNEIPPMPWENITISAEDPINPAPPTKYKYMEDRIINDFHAYIDKTYGQHYMTEEQNIECFDVWLALGDSMPTFRNTAIKYLWRYGKKHGSNRDDLMKVLHYTLMMLYVDHYKGKK